MAHPLYKKLSLLVVHLSGRHSLASDYQLQLQTSSRNHGVPAQEPNMIPYSVDGQHFVLQGKFILSPTIHDILAYLTSMFERGLEYSTISAAKSVLSSILHIPGVTAISEHPLIIRLLKGIFHVRPPRPRYELIWETDLVLTYLKGLEYSKIPLKFLSMKLVTLLTILSGQRVSTVHRFRISQMQNTPALIIFNIPGTRKGTSQYLFMLSLMILNYAQLPLLTNTSVHGQPW